MGKSATEIRQPRDREQISQLAALGCFFFFCIRLSADSIQPQLPADVIMNKDAGRGNFLIAMLQLGNSDALPFIVDTGSSITVLDKSLKSKLGKSLGTGSAQFPGNTRSDFYTSPKLSLEHAPLLTDSNVVVLDLKWLSKDAHRHVKGIIGFDCLKHYCIQLDFDAGKMRFLDSSHLDVKRLGKAFPITTTDPDTRPFVHHPGFTGGIETNCLIDTGCTYDGWAEIGALGSNHLSKYFWDTQIYTNINVAVGGPKNVLGLRFLARHLVTLDFPHQTLYLKQTSVGPLN